MPPRVPRSLPRPAARPAGPTGPIAKPVSKIGPIAGITDRTVAKSDPIYTNTGAGDVRSALDTFFTKDGQTDILYNGDRNWAKITLTLETAGPVAIGTLSSLSPVLSGKGVLLVTGVPTQLVIAKGTRLFVRSTSVNRISRFVEPLPWLEQITANVGSVAARLFALVTGKAEA